jgi:IclR family transcriptional regulator, KDG regulon repressor
MMGAGGRTHRAACSVVTAKTPTRIEGYPVMAMRRSSRSAESASPPRPLPGRTLTAPPRKLPREAVSGKKRLSSVTTAIALLKAFSEDEVEIGVSSLSRRLGVAKSTVHRLAVTLVSEGMLEQNPETGKYRLGIALFGLGALVRRRMDVSAEARPHLFRLRESTGETVHLAILDSTEIMYIYNLESHHAIRMRSDIGVRKPAYCTAEGLAILAFQPEWLVGEIIARGLTARTSKTNTSPKKLWKMLEQVRKQGYAIEDEQSETGMRSIAAPIRNSSGDVAAAVGVAGPVQRLSDAVLADFAPKVVETADTVSVRIGYRSKAAF